MQIFFAYFVHAVNQHASTGLKYKAGEGINYNHNVKQQIVHVIVGLETTR